MTGRTRLSIAAVVVSLAAFGAFLLAAHVIEPSPVGFITPRDPESARALVNTLARTAVTLISAVFASLFVAIPITASMYTPQLIELFVRSRINGLVLGFYVFSAAWAVWISRLLADGFVPRLQIGVSLLFVTVSFALLLPYLFSVFRFLNPDTIIARVAATVTEAMRERVSRAGDPAARVKGSGEGSTRRQRRLSRRIHELGNIVLRAIERADRGVALAGAEAASACASSYLNVKREQPPDWFAVGHEHFPGLSREAVVLLTRARTWVEMELLRELARAYDAAMARMPDVLSAISRSVRLFAMKASAAEDLEALDLAIRFFNNFLRQAIKRKDLHALYDVLYQYRLLATDLWPARPERTLRIARYLERYGGLAAAAGMPFAQDLAAYDLGAVAAQAAGSDRRPVNELIDVLLRMERPPGAIDAPVGPGMIKARLLLAARLLEMGRSRDAARIEENLVSLPPLAVQTAGADLLGQTEESFWEVTDRQQNLDWLPPSTRPRLSELLDRLSEGGSRP